MAQVKKLERSGALRAVQERVHAEVELRSRLQRCHRSVPSIRTALMSQVSEIRLRRPLCAQPGPQRAPGFGNRGESAHEGLEERAMWELDWREGCTVH
jgi:hypothetical protein